MSDINSIYDKISYYEDELDALRKRRDAGTITQRVYEHYTTQAKALIKKLKKQVAGEEVKKYNNEIEDADLVPKYVTPTVPVYSGGDTQYDIEKEKNEIIVEKNKAMQSGGGSTSSGSGGALVPFAILLAIIILIK